MKVLIVEDDQALATTLKSGLAADSHSVEVAENGADGSFLARTFNYDAIILDYSLPKKNGLKVCEEIRAAGKTSPILFLSVTEDTEVKVAALNAGADDYMTKPFSMEEIGARLRALSRRPHTLKENTLKVRDLELNPDTCTLTRAGVPIHLTRKEFSLLEYFMKNPGTVLSRALIMEHVWAADNDPFSNTVEAHLRNLRKKLNIDEKDPYIINVAGRGYILDKLTDTSGNVKS